MENSTTSALPAFHANYCPSLNNDLHHATSSTPATLALETWFRDHGGYLHPNIRIAYGSKHCHRSGSGIHYRATGAIECSTSFASAPHSLALSYLNALVDDAFPVFREQKHRFKVEAIGFWYLMAQYVNRETSFWKPYLDTLPAPDEEFTQPLFFEDSDDVVWLQGTDVWLTATARREVYWTYYNEGEAVLREAGVDTTPYNWDLFKWAVTMFSSRSFSSRAIHPGSSNSWTTYKSTASGSREPVRLDTSHIAPEDLDFPVLFPGLDAANHNPWAKIDWTFDPAHFSLALAERHPSPAAGENHTGIEEGQEVFNNYGPKGNGELLLGYGFCQTQNPHETVAMTLKQPPASLQAELKRVHPEYFNPTGGWDSEKTTFYLQSSSVRSKTPLDIFTRPLFPEPLLELLLYILRDEAALPFTPVQRPREYLTSPASPGRRWLLYIARMVSQWLAQKRAQFSRQPLPERPRNAKQTQASIYRSSQTAFLNSLEDDLRRYTHSRIWHPTPASQEPAGPSLLDLHALHTLLLSKDIVTADLINGIESNTNATDFTTLWLSGWEEDLWALLLAYLLLSPALYASHNTDVCDALAEYIPLLSASASALPSSSSSEDPRETENATDLLSFVRCAKETCGPGSVWADERWSVPFLLAVSGKLMADVFEVETEVSASVMGEGPRAGDAPTRPKTYLYLYFGARE